MGRSKSRAGASPVQRPSVTPGGKYSGMPKERRALLEKRDLLMAQRSFDSTMKERKTKDDSAELLRRRDELMERRRLLARRDELMKRRR